MATNIRTRRLSANSLAAVGADNADNNLAAKGLVGKPLLQQQENKKGTLVQRTRDALGDIGNRLTKKNATTTAGKPLGTMKPAAKHAVGGILKSHENLLAPTTRAAAATKPTEGTSRYTVKMYPDRKKSTFVRPNVLAPGHPTKQGPTVSKPENIKPKGLSVANLNRGQDLSKDALLKSKPPVEKENKLVSIFVPSTNETTEAKPKDDQAENKNSAAIKPNEVPSVETVAISEEKLPTDKLVDSVEAAKPENKFNNEVFTIDLTEEAVSVSVFSNQRFDFVDIDAVDEKNPLLLREYISDICNYLFALEKKYPINIRYLEGRMVNSRMRSVLLDWLVEVHHQFGFMPETLYMAAKTLDRYLQKERKITRKQLQLVGVTAMYVAAKFEEVCTPTVQDFSAVSDNAFTIAEVRQMERELLGCLDYDLSPPPAVFFLRRFSKAAGVSNGTAPMIVHSLAKYIMELTLVDYSTCHFYPSEQAAASLALSLMIMDKSKSLRELWSPTLEHYTRISLEPLKRLISPLVSILAKMHEEPLKLKSVYSKYGRNRLQKVSLIPELKPEEWKDRVLQDIC